MAIFLILSVLVALAYALLIGFCVAAWRAQVEEGGRKAALRLADEQLPTVSIVVVGRDEAAHVDALMSCLVAQDYPCAQYEIIYVDDHSEDGSVELLRAWAHRLHWSALPQPRFTFLRLGDYLRELGVERAGLVAFKKKAIECAVLRAKGTWVLCTDADCQMSAQWLRLMLHEGQAVEHRLRLGSVLMEEGAKSGAGWLLRRFQQLDGLGTMLLTAVGLRRGAQLANGANWAYRREDFAAVGGFAGIDAQASGDDMLLLHKIQKHLQTQQSTADAAAQFVAEPQAAVVTALKTSWGELWQQRRRWASKSNAYTQGRLKAILALVGLFSLLLLFTPLLCVFLQSNTLALLTAFLWVVKAAADWHLLSAAARHYERRHWLWAFAPALLLHTLYIVLAGLLALLAQKSGYTWKGRKVR